MYKSPVEIWHSEMEVQMEGEVLKACQRVGIQVDKEELLKALKYDRERYARGYEDGYLDGMFKDDWTPCEEALPTEEGTYLTTTENGAILVNHFYANGNRFGYHKVKTIAWMPLPQPYVKEGADDGKSVC